MSAPRSILFLPLILILEHCFLLVAALGYLQVVKPIQILLELKLLSYPLVVKLALIVFFSQANRL